jgi:hypothetical protein
VRHPHLAPAYEPQQDLSQLVALLAPTLADRSQIIKFFPNEFFSKQRTTGGQSFQVQSLAIPNLNLQTFPVDPPHPAGEPVTRLRNLLLGNSQENKMFTGVRVKDLYRARLAKPSAIESCLSSPRQFDWACKSLCASASQLFDLWRMPRTAYLTPVFSPSSP